MRSPGRAALLAGYAAMGVTSAAYPAALPQAGAQGVDPLLGIPLLFGMLLVGTLAAAALHRVDPRRLLLAGTAIQAAALLIAPGAFLPACAVAGLGFGLAEADANLLTRLLAVERTGASLAGMTAMVALAATACPVLLALLGMLVLPWLALVSLPAAILLLAWRGPLTAAAAGPAPHGIARLAPIALALVLFVGVETVVSGWSAVLPQQLLALDARAAAVGTSAFWLLMSAGRLLARILVGRALPGPRYLAIALGGAAVLLGAAAALGTAIPWLALAIAAVATVLLAPGYSLLLGAALAAIPAATARRATGILVALGAVGGTLVPLGVALAVGVSPSGALGVGAVLLVLVAALAIGHARLAPR